jgi:hypothetical protein
MSGEKRVRRSTKLSNWMIGALLAVVAVFTYGFIAVHVLKHGIN